MRQITISSAVFVEKSRFVISMRVTVTAIVIRIVVSVVIGKRIVISSVEIIVIRVVIIRVVEGVVIMVEYTIAPIRTIVWTIIIRIVIIAPIITVVSPRVIRMIPIVSNMIGYIYIVCVITPRCVVVRVRVICLFFVVFFIGKDGSIVIHVVIFFQFPCKEVFGFGIFIFYLRCFFGNGNTLCVNTVFGPGFFVASARSYKETEA